MVLHLIKILIVLNDDIHSSVFSLLLDSCSDVWDIPAMPKKEDKIFKVD